MRRPIRFSVLLTVLSGLTLLVGLPLAGSPASAHNSLESSTPAKGAALTVALLGILVLGLLGAGLTAAVVRRGRATPTGLGGER